LLGYEYPGPAVALFSMGLVKPTAFVISMVVGIEIHDRLLRLKPDTARAN
jgi:hypothetical protein